MTQTFPVLPLRDIVVFPQMIVPLFVGRDKSVAALATAMAADKQIFLVSQLDPAEDDPDREALYDLGVIATVLQLLKLPDGTVRVLVEGKQRATPADLTQEGGHLTARIDLIAGPAPAGAAAAGAGWGEAARDAGRSHSAGGAPHRSGRRERRSGAGGRRGGGVDARGGRP